MLICVVCRLVVLLIPQSALTSFVQLLILEQGNMEMHNCFSMLHPPVVFYYSVF